MKPAPFAYLAAGSVAEAVSALAEHGDDAVVLAGGQSLLPLLNMRLARPALVVDIGRIAGLDGIAATPEGGLRMGARVTQAAALRSPLVAGAAPLLVEALRRSGHAATRARGTVGGSAAHADPAAELPAALLALDGAVVLAGAGGAERRVAARDFFTGPFTTARAGDELVVALELPPAPAGLCHGFHEVARRTGDFALAGAAVAVVPGGAHARIALFGVAPAAFRATAAEQALAAGAPAAEVAALATAASAPHDDVHATAAYRRRTAAVAVERALAAATGAVAAAEEARP